MQLGKSCWQAITVGLDGRITFTKTEEFKNVVLWEELISDDSFRYFHSSTGVQVLDGRQMAPNNFPSSLYYPVELGLVVLHRAAISDSETQRQDTLYHCPIALDQHRTADTKTKCMT